MRPRTPFRVMACLLLALLLLSLGSEAVLAEAIVLEDGFDGKDGDAPDEEHWETVGVDGGDRVRIVSETLEVYGNASVRTKEAYHADGLTLEVDFAARSLAGQVLNVAFVSEEDEAELLLLTYNTTVGWTVVNHLTANASTFESNVTNLTVDTWYELEFALEEEDYELRVVEREGGEAIFNDSGAVEAAELKFHVELGTGGAEVNFDDAHLVEADWKDEINYGAAIALFVIFFIVLLGPFLIKQIEHQLEIFLFVMGVMAVTLDTFLLTGVEAGGHGHEIAPVWGAGLVIAGLKDPLMITAAVLFAGLAFHYGRNHFKAGIEKLLAKIDMKVFIFIIVVTLGLVASLITAIISALLLVEVVTVLKLDKKTETDLTILTCFSIGLGAALTPVGEPLSTIVIVTKLKEDFWYLAIEIGKYIIPSIIAIGAFAVYYMSRSHIDRDTLSEDKEEEQLKEVPIRAFKVYLFVMALVFLGTGFAPIIEWFIKNLDASVLFWVNTSSAILDNATLASAEIVPTMSQFQINAALMALLFSGGMLIPGNIPNIIAANKLHITSKEWARFGAPFGFFWLALFFVILFVLKI